MLLILNIILNISLVFREYIWRPTSVTDILFFSGCMLRSQFLLWFCFVILILHQREMSNLLAYKDSKGLILSQLSCWFLWTLLLWGLLLVLLNLDFHLHNGRKLPSFLYWIETCSQIPHDIHISVWMGWHETQQQSL